MKRNLVGKILGKIKIFVQDFVPIRTALTRKFSGKISSPKISSGNFGSNSPSRGNFEAQNFLETRGNFYEEILGSLDNRTEISTFSQYWMMPLLYSHMHRVTQTLPQERALTNMRGRTDVLAGMMIDFFVSWRQEEIFTRKFWDHLIIELKSVPFPSTG